MTTTKLQHGDRIRKVDFDVVVDVNGKLSKQKVTLRYDWTGADPEHTCVASLCTETCIAEASHIAMRRASRGMGKADLIAVTSVTPTHDGQPKGGFLDRKVQAAERELATAQAIATAIVTGEEIA